MNEQRLAEIDDNIYNIAHGCYWDKKQTIQDLTDLINELKVNREKVTDLHKLLHVIHDDLLESYSNGLINLNALHPVISKIIDKL